MFPSRSAPAARPVTTSAGSKGALLQELRVLELGESVAVRYAGATLAAMGAQVHSMGSQQDRPGRHNDQDLGAFLSRDKLLLGPDETASLDFDVCIGDRGPAMEALSVRCPVVAVRWPEVFSEYAEAVALSSLSGASIAIGEPGRSPLDMPDESSSFLVGSVVAGTALTVAYGADRAAVVDFDAVSVLVSFFDQNATSYAVRGIPWAREGRRASMACGIHPYAVYGCADDTQVVITARSNQDWVDVAEAIGGMDLLAEYPDALGIVDDGHLDEVDDRTAVLVKTFTQAELVAIAERTGVLIAPVATMDEVLTYGQLSERDYWVEWEGLRMPGLPWVLRD
jgi:crotonobetainyl-CoA:carnitine CoA-transferase CaiB-like acyl-CoA transferase